MKHLLLFPVWFIFAIIVSIIALLVALFRWKFDKEIYGEVWSYKEFVRISTNKAKAGL